MKEGRIMFYLKEDHKKNLPTVRLQRAILRNFKSVEYGEIVFDCSKRFVSYGTKSDILGIYGQNGSGKTSFIEALSILELLLNGGKVPGVYADCVAKGAEYAQLEFEFELQYTDSRIRRVIYGFCMAADENVNDDKYNSDVSKSDTEPKFSHKVRIFNEKLSMSGDFEDGKIKMQPIIDTTTSSIMNPFEPKSKRKAFIGDDDEETLMKLTLSKKFALEKSKSFIFCEETVKIFNEKDYYCEYYQVILELHYFSQFFFFVIDTKSSGLIRLNAGLLIYSIFGVVHVKTDGPTQISERLYEDLQEIFKGINIVLPELVPGLTIDIRKISSTLLKNGDSGFFVEFLALRNGVELPLGNESDGVRKIISYLNLIIIAYNQKSTTIAIDEFDAGVFEYLLGEILQVFQESGKGQFIFTSHNLRPLEVIDKKYLYFTTSNPKNRYIQLKNIGKTNNLRNTYYREIVLGEQDEELYIETKRYNIATAFRKAGREYGEEA